MIINFLNKIFKYKTTKKDVESMGTILIGKEIFLKGYSSTDPLTINEVKGLNEINNCRYVEMVGTNKDKRVISVVVTVKAFKNLCKQIIELNNGLDDVYIKDITNDK